MDAKDGVAHYKEEKERRKKERKRTLRSGETRTNAGERRDET